jgi:hypothetical protein
MRLYAWAVIILPKEEHQALHLFASLVICTYLQPESVLSVFLFVVVSSWFSVMWIVPIMS